MTTYLGSPSVDTIPIIVGFPYCFTNLATKASWHVVRSVIDVLPGGAGALVGAGRHTRPRSHVLQLLGCLQCPSPLNKARAAPEPSRSEVRCPIAASRPDAQTDK